MPIEAKRIRERREEFGITQAEFAEKLGISHSESKYVFERCLDACKGCYDAVFEVEVHIG